MWQYTFLMGLFIEAVLGASLVPCPDSCSCVVQPTKDLEIQCKSLDFLTRLTPKQINVITKLNISGSNLELLNPKLKQLKNLVSLDLSHNKLSTVSPFPTLPVLKKLNLNSNILKEVKVTELPRNLESVDVSHNHISYVSNDWSTLSNLKRLNMDDNRLDCDCESLLTYDKLNNHVTFDKPLTCFTPSKFKGKELNALNCSIITEHLLNTMLGDEGADDEHTPIVDETDSSNTDNDDQDYFATDTNKDMEDSETLTNDKNDKLEEGSGDEGSGLIVEDITPPIACHFNCSTVNPLGINDSDDSSPEPPPIKEQSQILYEDVFGSDDNTINEKTTENPATEEIELTTVSEANEEFKHLIPIEAIPHNEKEKEKLNLRINDKDEVETFTTTDIVEGEMERASVIGKSQNSSSTYYVLGGILLLFVALIVLIVIKKRSRGKKNTKPPKENGHYQEMKPLGKSAEKPIEAVIKAPESTPLMSDTNGKLTENGDTLDANLGDDEDDELNEVFTNGIKSDKEVTPQPERLKVTVKVGEIPDSVPKTPLIVHRQLNHDGNYTTSPTFQS